MCIRDRNYYVYATNPAGPWSNPIWLKDAPGIDPSLFFDEDGLVIYKIEYKKEIISRRITAFEKFGEGNMDPSYPGMMLGGYSPDSIVDDIIAEIDIPIMAEKINNINAKDVYEKYGIEPKVIYEYIQKRQEKIG